MGVPSSGNGWGLSFNSEKMGVGVLKVLFATNIFFSSRALGRNVVMMCASVKIMHQVIREAR